jgi:RHS repeat-associated protein
VTDEWSYNANNELQGYDDVSYEYDENGSITQKTVGGVITRFFYNIEGRLERVEDGSSNVIAEYYYDPFGRRLWKETSGSTVFFQYADEGLVAEYDGTGAEIKTYGYKPGSTWTTDPLFMKEGAEYYFYHNDHLGIPQKLTALNGAVVWGAQYEAFGKASVDGSSTVTNNLRFPGQYFDDETGLHYNWYRYFFPQMGRYLKTDPIGLKGGINFYLYSYNNPIGFFDAYGLYVTMVCRPLSIPIAGTLGYVHCAVFVWHIDKCFNVVIDKQFSLRWGDQQPLPQGSGDPTYIDDRNAFFNLGKGGNGYYLIPPPPGMNQKQFDQAVIKAGDSYKQGPYDPLRGPNSNTAADNIIERGGGKVPDVPRAPGQNYGDYRDPLWDRAFY